jgi:hypothetical protein
MSSSSALTSAAADERQTFFKLAFAIGIMVAGLEIGYLLHSPLPYDPVGYLVGRDFANTWLGARLALTGHPQAYFAVDAYNRLLADEFGGNYPFHIWSYPPHFLLFTWPLALLPYMTAYILYCAAGLAVYLVVIGQEERRIDHFVLLTTAPVVIVNIWCGQNGFFIAALLAGGLIVLDRRPILAGLLFGILSIKPQLGILLPLMLVLTGRWRTVLAAAITILLLVTAAAFVFGPDVWTAYIDDAMPVQSRVFLREFENFMTHMPTVFMNARVAGLPLPAAVALQIGFSLLAIAAVTWTFWRRRDADLSNALLVSATFLVTPYAFNYDMVVFGWVIIRLMDRSDNTMLDYALMLAVWALPFLTVVLGIAGIPLSFLPVAGMTWRLLWRLGQKEKFSAGFEANPADRCVAVRP